MIKYALLTIALLLCYNFPSTKSFLHCNFKAHCRIDYQQPTNTKVGSLLWHKSTNSLLLHASSVPIENEDKLLRNRLDREFFNISVPAFVGFATEPLLSIVEGIYVARLGASEQAGMGASNFAQYSVAKLYNDPLLKTTTSLVAGKSGEELSASVSTAIITAMFIGVVQSIGYALFAQQILKLVSVVPSSDMYLPALQYLRWKALGVPASTVLIVTNGIFRGRGDTQTPLYYNTLGTVVNLVLDPLLMFTAGLGISGLGLAFSLSQWLIVLPLLYLLYQKTPFQIVGLEMNFLRKALVSYLKAGSLIFLRTVAKISTYTMASSAAAKLGTTSMAAYSMTFSLGFTASQLCESLAVAAQALLARDMPLDSERKVKSARHVVRRSLQLGLLVTLCLTSITILNLNNILGQMTKSAEVRAAALHVMPIVLLTQIFKGVSSSTGGILLGGLDWTWTTTGMILASVLSIASIQLLPKSLYGLWIALSIFTSTQVLVALLRIFSNSGPWKGLVPSKIIESDNSAVPPVSYKSTN